MRGNSKFFAVVYMRAFFAVVCLLFFNIGYVNASELNDALRATYVACVGIDDELSDLKKMAGINTAVTAVGTAAGAGATIVGIVKANKDAKAKEKFDNYMNSKPVQVMNKNSVDAFFAAWEKYEWGQGDAAEFQKLRKQSKTLGNWRTGLIAGNAATNIAGAIIAGNNKVDKDLKTQINDCKVAVNNLKNATFQARISGEDISEANEIIAVCGEYDYIDSDVSKINGKAKGAFVSSVVGAATGVAGTVTSAIANSEKVRKDETVNTKTGEDWQAEKNWNTAANVLAGTSTVASGVATVFNAMQISAIKKVADVASKCTGVLK